MAKRCDDPECFWEKLDELTALINKQDVSIRELTEEVSYLNEKINSQSLMLSDAFRYIKDLEARTLFTPNEE
jgi:hypothetical protein